MRSNSKGYRKSHKQYKKKRYSKSYAQDKQRSRMAKKSEADLDAEYAIAFHDLAVAS